ncbi:sigma-70 domain-containing protein, partial [Acinetobacter pittii]|uniref:sigma-70 domain-containing protein n=1 Tax=Acinetobacter pittii TaxID=48296 RepID=UPI0028144ED1
EMLDTADHGDEFLRREILQGIQALQETLEEEKKRDHRMVEKVSELDESITKLTEEMGRKITIEELSMFMDLPVDEIVSVMQLAGEDVEVGEV